MVSSVRINTSIITNPLELIKILLPFNIISCMRERTKFPAQVLSQLSDLKFITTTGMRNNGIDLESCRRNNIVVSGTAQPNNATGTVEQTFALLLAISRRIVVEDRSMRSGGFQTGIAISLNAKTIGLIGLGRLGSQVARVAQAFGMKVIVWSPHMTQERADLEGCLSVSLEHLLSTADVISLHLILSESTRDVLDVEELSLVKPTAIIINTSRGELINEVCTYYPLSDRIILSLLIPDFLSLKKGMLSMLRERRIAGIGLDVYKTEPLPKDHELRAMDNVALSPHMGYVDDDTYDSWWPQTIENIAAFMEGNPIRLLQPLKPSVF